MCLKVQPPTEIPAETVRVAQAAFPKGSALMRLRDELGELFTAGQFADLFPAKGQPAVSPGRLALVVVLQCWEGLTDRQAADAVRSRIDWKYALGLELTDPGFNFSVLSEFRERLVEGQATQRLLEVVLEAFKTRGLLKARGRQRTDSTYVLQAVRELNRVERVGETLRAALNALAQAGPDWLRGVVPAEWLMRYGSRFEQMHLPKAAAERQQLIEQIGQDGFSLLGALKQPTTPAELKDLPAVQLLGQIWAQQYAVDESVTPRQVRWRGNGQLPPASELILSPYEPEARYCVRGERKWEGYRVHLTETCDDEAELHVITQVETAPAPEQDETALPRIQAALARQDLLPQEQLADAGYVSADLLVDAKQTYAMELIGPFVKDVSWQAREQSGYDLTRFTIDWQARQAICPQGQRSSHWFADRDRRGLPGFQAVFSRATCQPCPARAQCTRSTAHGRHLHLRPQTQHEAIQQARATHGTATFRERYKARMGIEGTVSQAVRAFGLRRSRYVGQAKTHLQMVATAVAINFERLVDYLRGDRPMAERQSAFAALAPP